MTEKERHPARPQATGGAASDSGRSGSDGSDSQGPKRSRRRRRRSRRRGPAQGGSPQDGTGQNTPSQDSRPQDTDAAGAGQAERRQGQQAAGGQESAGGRSRSRSRGRRRNNPGGSTGGSNQQSQNPQEKQETPARTTSTGQDPSRGRRRAGSRNRRRGAQSQPRAQQRAPQRGAQNRRGAATRGRMTTRDETSAGGLVVSGLMEAVNERGEVDLSRIYVALIGRLDRRGRLLWSMPKGHVEPGEDHGVTAAREVWEETGIQGEVFAELGTIDYWFVSDGVRIHKTVHHHLLRYLDGDLNDEDPEVTEVSWIPVSELIEHLAYADERKLARIAHDLLPDLAREEKAAGRATPR